MILDFSEDRKLTTTLFMIEEFSKDQNKITGKRAWNVNLFKIDKTSKPLDDIRAKLFHTFVIKAMFLCKKARQDTQTGVSFLSTRVREPTESDWIKLCKLMRFLDETKEDITTLSMDKERNEILWYVDAAFGVH
jgi:hypothetical protein